MPAYEGLEKRLSDLIHEALTNPEDHEALTNPEDHLSDRTDHEFRLIIF
jgi:hypothetical protein